MRSCANAEGATSHRHLRVHGSRRRATIAAVTAAGANPRLRERSEIELDRFRFDDRRRARGTANEAMATSGFPRSSSQELEMRPLIASG
jgi:hypothetical protein